MHYSECYNGVMRVARERKGERGKNERPPVHPGARFPRFPRSGKSALFALPRIEQKKLTLLYGQIGKKSLTSTARGCIIKQKNANEGKEMKLTENKTKRLEIRLTEEDHKLLKVCAYTIGQTPSSMVRMFIDTTLNAMKLKIKKGEIKLEDYEAIFDDKL